MTKKPARQTRRRAPGPDLRVSPLLAYAEGTSAEAWKTPSPFVAGCIGVAAMLQAAARERSAALRQQLFDRAIDQVTGLLDPGETSLGSSIDPLEIRSVLRPFSSAADRLARRVHA